MLKRKDWWIICIALLGALALFVVIRVGGRERENLLSGENVNGMLQEVTQTPWPSQDDTVSATPTPDKSPAVPVQATVYVDLTQQPDVNAEDAIAYLRITVGSTKYKPIPLNKETDYVLTQDDGKENVIHVTRDSIVMKSATCDNQNCIEQGTVTLDNMETRVLGNMIICLPNQVVLELLTVSDAEGSAT